MGYGSFGSVFLLPTLGYGLLVHGVSACIDLPERPIVIDLNPHD